MIAKFLSWAKENSLYYVMVFLISMCFVAPIYTIAVKTQDIGVAWWMLALTVALVFLRYMKTNKSLYVCLLNSAISGLFLLVYPYEQPYLLLGSLAFIVVIRIGEVVRVVSWFA